ncbi:MAG: RNA-binding protein [Acidobacteriota bacterium]
MTRTPALGRRNKVRKLFIGNVSYEANEDDLRKLCREIGPIVRFNLVPTRGIAFCTYEDEVDAARAIDDLNKRLYMGRRLVVEEARDAGQR